MGARRSLQGVARRVLPGHHADPPVFAIGDHEVAGGVRCHSYGVVEFRAGSPAAVTGEPNGAVAGDGVDVPGGHRLPVERPGGFGHDPDPGVEAVGDHQVPRRVRYRACREVEFGAGGWAAVTGEPDDAVAGDGVDVPGGHRLPVERPGAFGHHPDPGVEAVGDHQVPRRVDCNCDRVPQCGMGGRAAVTGELDAAVAGHGVDEPGDHLDAVERAASFRHDADPVVSVIGDQQVPGRVEGHPAGVHPGAGGGAEV